MLNTISKTGLLVLVAECMSQLGWLRVGHHLHPLREMQLYDDGGSGP